MSIEVTYRLAREDDLSAMRLIQSTALRDLIAREGGDPSTMPITDQPSAEMRHILRTDPALAWIAVEDGRPIGFSAGIVRRELWFLSDLFVLPEAHRGGIGGELLRHCLAAGKKRGARIIAVESSGDPPAQSLYIRAGMVPRFPLFAIKGPARQLSRLPVSRHAITPITASRTWVRRLGDLDETVWGRRRDGDHRFWLGDGGKTCLGIANKSGALLAYVYYDHRIVGPLAARTARLQLPLLRAIGDTLGGQPDAAVELRVPGIDATMLSALLEAGLRIDHVGLFMASRPFGRFERYVPSGGTLL